jgi:pimeloyl-CoA dehydrogenase
MDLQLTPEQKAFRDDVRMFIEERLPHDIRDRLRAGHPPRKEDTVRWQRILNERGWAAPHWPGRFGGAELSQAERLILMDELYRAPAPLPQVFNITMLGPVLMKYGTQEQCEFFLPKLANLDLWFCQGFSEPGSGSDLASLRTAARREGDHYIVNGQKIWTTTAHWADWTFALVRTDPEARKQEGISFLLIDLKSPGITIRPITSIDGEHHLNEVFFDDVRVPVTNLVGQENKGWDCAKFLLGNERTGIANVGLCRERLEHARNVAVRTPQGAGRLIDDPKLQSELASLDAEIRALEVTSCRPSHRCSSSRAWNCSKTSTRCWPVSLDPLVWSAVAAKTSRTARSLRVTFTRARPAFMAAPARCRRTSCPSSSWVEEAACNLN